MEFFFVLVGMFIGGFLGSFFTCACVVASKYDDEVKEEYEKN